MDLYLAALQVVPMLFIALFLNQQHGKPASSTSGKSPAGLRFFHLAVAILGLLAFSLSVFVVGSHIAPPAWVGAIVATALACAMAALSTQVFLSITRKNAEE